MPERPAKADASSRPPGANNDAPETLPGAKENCPDQPSTEKDLRQSFEKLASLGDVEDRYGKGYCVPEHELIPDPWGRDPSQLQSSDQAMVAQSKPLKSSSDQKKGSEPRNKGALKGNKPLPEVCSNNDAIGTFTLQPNTYSQPATSKNAKSLKRTASPQEDEPKRQEAMKHLPRDEIRAPSPDIFDDFEFIDGP